METQSKTGPGFSPRICSS